jgi:hypothetical protein
LFVMTRSTAILDLDAAGPGETILYCPANHAPPWRVVPVPGAPGYEALASCLATPEVRARTAGTTATLPASRLAARNPPLSPAEAEGRDSPIER